MPNEGKTFVKPGWVQTIANYDKVKHETIQRNNKIMDSKGLKPLSFSVFGSIQSTTEEKMNLDCVNNDDDKDYYQPENEEGLSSSSDDDEFYGSQSKKGTLPLKEKQRIVKKKRCRKPVGAMAATLPAVPTTGQVQPSLTSDQTQAEPTTNQPYPPPTTSAPESDTPSPPESDTPSPQSVELSPQVIGAGPSSSKRKRGPTLGKSLDKLLAHNEGEKLVVTVPEEMNAFCGVNATMAATDLGVQIRRRCPTEGFASSWKFVDPLTKAAILQSNQDKFDIQDGIEGNPLANAVFNKKASLLYKDWKCRMRTHYRKLTKAHLNAYIHPYPGVSMAGWKYLIDHVFKDSKMKKRWRAGKKNRKKLPHNHTMGSRSFPAAISIEAKENGNKPFDFCAFFKKSHMRKNKQWIKPSCQVQHAEMEKVRDEAKQSGIEMTAEELSTKVLKQGKNRSYIRGLGVGPTRTSLAFKSQLESRAHSELLSIRSEMDLLREQQQREREEYQLEREKLLKERDEQQKQHERERGKKSE